MRLEGACSTRSATPLDYRRRPPQGTRRRATGAGETAQRRAAARADGQCDAEGRGGGTRRAGGGGGQPEPTGRRRSGQRPPSGPTGGLFASTGSEGRRGPAGGGDPEPTEARRGPTEPREAGARPGARSRGPERQQAPAKQGGPTIRGTRRGRPADSTARKLLRKSQLYQIVFFTAAA